MRYGLAVLGLGTLLTAQAARKETPPLKLPVCADTYSIPPAIDIEIERMQQTRAQELKRIEACGNNKECQAQVLADTMDPASPENKSFLTKIFGKSCLSGGRGSANITRRARKMYVQNVIATLAVGGGGSYVVQKVMPKLTPDPADDKTDLQVPVGLIAQGQITTLMAAELFCRNAANRGENPDKQSRQLSYWQNMKNYMGFSLINNSLYFGLTTAEDWTRGEDITSPEKIKELLSQAVFSFASDALFGHLNVVKMDELLWATAPAVAQQIGQMIRSGQGQLKYFKDTNQLIFLVKETARGAIKATAWTTEQGIDAGSRLLYSFVRSLYFQTAMAGFEKFIEPTSPFEAKTPQLMSPKIIENLRNSSNP